MFCPKCGEPNDAQARFCKVCASNLDNVTTRGANLDSVTTQRNIVKYAGFWRRFAAYIIDSILIIAVFSIIAMFGAFFGLFRGVGSIMIAIIVVMIPWFYWAAMESSSKQATLGKMALSVIVTDLEGNRISFGRASERYWAKIISYLILYVGYIMAGFTAKKQALHDIFAGCLVIVKSPSEPSTPPG